MQQKMITQKRTQAECRPRYQEVAVDHTAVSDMKYKQMNRAVLTEFLSYSSTQGPSMLCRHCKSGRERRAAIGRTVCKLPFAGMCGYSAEAF